jgi:hypothetical protein
MQLQSFDRNSNDYIILSKAADEGKIKRIEIATCQDQPVSTTCPEFTWFIRVQNPSMDEISKTVRELAPIGVEFRNKHASARRYKTLQVAVFAAFLPPLVIFGLGHLSGWVLSGFRGARSAQR